MKDIIEKYVEITQDYLYCNEELSVISKNIKETNDDKILIWLYDIKADCISRQRDYISKLRTLRRAYNIIKGGDKDEGA